MNETFFLHTDMNETLFLHTKPWIPGGEKRYSWLLFTSEGRLCLSLRMLEQSTNMMLQCQYLRFGWRHRSNVVTSQC